MPLAREFGFRNPGIFCFWNPESGENLLMESGILGFGIRNTAQDSGITLTIEIQNPSSTDRDWNPVTAHRIPLLGIQNLRLSWISLRGAGCNSV